MSTTATTADNCLHCQAPIEQPQHGGRPRKFCNKAGCRKAESRAQKLAAIHKADQKQKEALEKTWLQFDSETQEYLHSIVENEGLDAASRATNLVLHLLLKERQEQAQKEDNSLGQRVPSGRTLTGTSTADLMQETAARLEALSAKTAKERDVFVNRQGLVLGRLYASLVPYLAEDTNTREKSLTLSQTYKIR